MEGGREGGRERGLGKARVVNVDAHARLWQREIVVHFGAGYMQYYLGLWAHQHC
jgi:hypothetical protein